MVGEVGFEPTMPEDNRFTVCRSTPTLPLTYIMEPVVGFEPTKLTRGFTKPVLLTTKGHWHSFKDH